LFFFAPARAWADDKVLSGLTEGELRKAFDQLSPKWYPITVRGYAKGRESRYDITWRRGDPGWYLFWDLTPEKYAEHKARLKKKGMKVDVESSWIVNGETRYAAIWRNR
jgi:hypothetical protein